MIYSLVRVPRRDEKELPLITFDDLWPANFLLKRWIWHPIYKQVYQQTSKSLSINHPYLNIIHYCSMVFFNCIGLIEFWSKCPHLITLIWLNITKHPSYSYLFQVTQYMLWSTLIKWEQSLFTDFIFTIFFVWHFQLGSHWTISHSKFLTLFSKFYFNFPSQYLFAIGLTSFI